jgi:tRNA(Ile)-lysidine synthase TilS/MesJ
MKINPSWLPKEKFTFLVSGGVDSIAAAHWLKTKFRRDFDVLHFNHSGCAINDRMEESVKRFCDDLNISFTCIKRDKEQFTDESEGGFREFRLFHLTKRGGDYVTAHQADDAEEQYLMNCFNGVPQYIPIKPVWSEPPVGIYHPFLLVRKNELNDYLVGVKGLATYLCEDPTNSDPNHCRRNWIRNIIIPQLREQGIVLHNHVRKYYE